MQRLAFDLLFTDIHSRIGMQGFRLCKRFRLMAIDSIIRTISLILAPAVMISSCAIFLSGIITRYESVSARMRAMHLERLELLQGLRHTTSSGVSSDGFSNHRIQEIENQLPHLLQRHKLLRNAVLAENASIALFVTSMFIIALASLTNSSLIATTALLIFLTGTGGLLVGVIITTLELSRSQREVTYEIQDGLKLKRDDLM
jgi:hypothetical protein